MYIFLVCTPINNVSVPTEVAVGECTVTSSIVLSDQTWMR